MGIPTGLLQRSVQRVRPATSTDAYGNTVRNYTSGATTTTISAWLEQDKGDELRPEGRDAIERLWTMITNESDIDGYDRITFGSLTFEVEGPAAPVYTPGAFHHTEVKLRLVTG